MELSELEWLEEFFWDCCKDGWGNNRGVKINTLSNPGWSLEIILEDTNLEDIMFEDLSLERSEHDWIMCRIRDKKFEGYGGPKNLSEMIGIFRKWVEECDSKLNNRST